MGPVRRLWRLLVPTVLAATAVVVPARIGVWVAPAVLLVVCAAVSVTRRREPQLVARLAPLGAGNPYPLAYLAGGCKRALLAALAALRAAGRIDVGERPGQLRRVEQGDSDLVGSEFESQVLARFTDAAGEEVSESPPADPLVEQLRGLALNLVHRGLVLAPYRLARLRRCAWWSTCVGVFLVVEMARITTAAERNRTEPDIELLTASTIELVLAAATAITILLLSPRAHRAKIELARLRAQHSHLSPSMRPDWAAYGPDGAALAVALFGAAALRTGAAPFAAAVLDGPGRRSTMIRRAGLSTTIPGNDSPLRLRYPSLDAGAPVGTLAVAWLVAGCGTGGCGSGCGGGGCGGGGCGGGGCGGGGCGGN